MTIAVTTPTGKVGHTVARTLLDRGHKPTLIARDPARVRDLAQAGARVVVGSHGDPELLVEATRGAQALFLLTPPDFGMSDIRGHYRRFGEAAARAIRDNGIARVVHLSSVGAELAYGNGPIAGLFVNETMLYGAAGNLVQLRPGYFMENTLGQIPSIASAGKMFTSLPGDARIAMIATRDIGERAAELLADPSWSGQRVVELPGPEEISYDDVARILSEVLGRPVSHVTVTPEQQSQALMGMGASRVMADSFAEMGEALESGRIRFREPAGAGDSALIRFPEFAQKVFKPAFEAALAA